MQRTACLTIFAISSFALANSADAHLQVTSQQSRYGTSQKAGPCGLADGERTTDKVYIAKPGTQFTLVWEETVDHNPAFYRINFDLDGVDDFVDPHIVNAAVCDAVDEPANAVDVCFDRNNIGPYMINDIPDDAAAVQNMLYTLPDVECDNCTLQVVQVMLDKYPFVTPGNDLYYQCVDIILANDGPDVLTLVEPPAAPDAGPTPSNPDAGPTTGGGGGEVDGGCSTGGTSGSALFVLFALGLIVIRRRR